MLNYMKTNEPRITKYFRNILLWILKNKNQAKVRNLKSFGHGGFMKFFRLEKMFLIAIFLFIDRFKKTLDQNLWFDQLFYWMSEKITFSKKKPIYP